MKDINVEDYKDEKLKADLIRVFQGKNSSSIKAIIKQTADEIISEAKTKND